MARQVDRTKWTTLTLTLTRTLTLTLTLTLITLTLTLTLNLTLTYTRKSCLTPSLWRAYPTPETLTSKHAPRSGVTKSFVIVL